MVRLLSFWLQCFQMDFPKPVPRERKKQSRYSSPGTSQWYRSSKCCWCYTHFSTYHLFSVQKIPLFCTWSLCLAQAQTIPDLLYWGGTPYTVYTDNKKQTNWISVYIHFSDLFPAWLCDEWTVCMETNRTWYYSCPWAGNKSIFFSCFFINRNCVISLYWGVPCIYEFVFITVRLAIVFRLTGLHFTCVSHASDPLTNR